MNFEALIDRVVPIDEAPAAYDELAKADGALPLGVLIHYPDDEPRHDAEPARVTLRGHRQAPGRAHQLRAGRRRRVRHGMLVPQMRKRRGSLLPARRRQPHRHAGQQLRARQPGRDADQRSRRRAERSRISPRGDRDAASRACRSGGPFARGRQARVRREAAGDDRGRSSSRWSSAYSALAERAAADGRLQPPLLTGAAGVEGAAGRPPIAADDPVPAQRRLHSARPLGARRPGRRPQYRRGVPHVRRVPVPDRRAGALGRCRGDRSARRCRTRATTTSPRPSPTRTAAVASLVYTALGPKTGLGKEHITVFCDGEAFIVDDFKKLTRASDGVGAVAERRAGQGPLRGAEPVRRRDRRRRRVADSVRRDRRDVSGRAAGRGSDLRTSAEAERSPIDE